MNVLESVTIRSPNEIEEECAHFTITDTEQPFVLNDIAKPDEKYTFSAWVKGPGEISISGEKFPVSEGWTKCVITFVSESVNVEIYFRETGEYYLYNSQLEVGEKDTDYSPAPEDLEADVEGAKNIALDAAKTATNFLGFDASGLVVGDRTAETLGRNILIDNDSVAIRSGDAVLAEYGDSYVYLGKDNAKSIIDLCNGCATLYNEDSLDGTGKYKRLMIKAGDSINLDAPNGIYQSCFRRQDFNNSADARFDMSTSDIWVDGSILTKYSHIGLSLFNMIDGQVSTQDIDMNSKGVYISSSNSSTDKAAEIKLFSGDNTDIFSAYIGLKVNGYIFLNDNTSVDSDGNLYTNRLCVENEASGGLIRAKNTSGEELGLAGMSSANNMWFGYGNYYAGSGQTNLYGNDIQVYVKQAATNYRPYYRKGMNTGTIKWYGAGCISNSSKTLYFTIPLSVPIIGSPTVTVTSVDGFQVRQGAKYLYGSGASTLVKPSSYTAAISGNGMAVLVTATMANTTNVVNNNDSCGIHASIKVTFS